MSIVIISISSFMLLGYRASEWVRFNIPPDT